MPLMPKRVKFRKSQRGTVKGNASRGNTVSHGEFGLQALEGGWLSAEAIEAGRITATHSVRGEGRLYIRVFPHKSITAIPAETRMGKGKGEPEYWAAVVKPGMIIGKKGQEVDKLTKDLQNLTDRHIEVKTMEVNRPEVDPQLVAEDVAEQLQKRASFRRTMKRAIDTTMEAGAKGVRVQLSGRLAGAEMARTESAMAGSIPLSTLRAKIDYGFTEAKTPQGHIGVKVWINNGDYLEEGNDASDAQAGKVPKKSARRRPR